MSEEKNMFIAVLLSFVIPGSGNIYNGLLKRGVIEFIISLILIPIFSVAPPIYIIWYFYVLYDTYTQNKAINNRNNHRYHYNNTNPNNFNNQNNNNTPPYNNPNNNNTNPNNQNIKKN